MVSPVNSQGWRSAVKYTVFVGTGEIDQVAGHVAATFEAATLLSGTGVWHGPTESSTVAELVLTGADERLVLELGQRLCGVFGQESVLILRAEVDAALVQRPD